MAIDMSKYLGLFVSESTEHLEALGRGLVSLESAGGTGTIDDMFRHAHSVKGMASSMGFQSIAVLAHRVEDLVDSLREDASRSSGEVVDLLLAAVDALQAQVRAAGAGEPMPDDGALLVRLSEKVSQLTGQAVAPTRVAQALVNAPAASPDSASAAPEPGVAKPAATAGLLQKLNVQVRIAETCQTPGVRGFLVHKRLSALGELSSIKPPLEDVRAGRIPDGHLSLELLTSAGETGILKALSHVPETRLLSIHVVAEGDVPPPAPKREEKPTESSPTVRIRTELLDYFLDAAGELMLATARIREVSKQMPEGIRPQLDESVYRLQALVKEFHEKVIGARMTPLTAITDRLPRVARDVARRCGKEVELVVTGAETELDKAIVDELSDPLLHLLRNCVDHGLETPEQRAQAQKPVKGRIEVRVQRDQDRVVLEIQDDGRGMDAAKLKAAAVARGSITGESAARMTDKEAFLLCCLPGVSTAEDISEVSGRGVGMDAVKRSVENMSGTLDIDSRKGQGTRFTLRLPVTVSVVHLLLVQVGEEVVGLPIGKVQGAMDVAKEGLSHSRGERFLPLGDSLVPVHPLSGLLGVPDGVKLPVNPYVLMEVESGRVALEVDRLVGQEEVVLKSLPNPLDRVPGLAGVTILGTGRPIFILDVPRLIA
jgi:two-component system chemotaxis sensor kinase CheA